MGPQVHRRSHTVTLCSTETAGEGVSRRRSKEDPRDQSVTRQRRVECCTSTRRRQRCARTSSGPSAASSASPRSSSGPAARPAGHLPHRVLLDRRRRHRRRAHLGPARVEPPALRGHRGVDLGTEGARYSATPDLGVFHAVTGLHGDIMIPEDRLKAAVVKAPSARPPSSSRSTSCSAARGTTSWSLPPRRRRCRRALAAPGGLSRRARRLAGSAFDSDSRNGVIGLKPGARGGEYDEVAHPHEVLGGLVLDADVETLGGALEDLHHRQRVDPEVVDEGRSDCTSAGARPVTRWIDLRRVGQHVVTGHDASQYVRRTSAWPGHRATCAGNIRAANSPARRRDTGHVWVGKLGTGSG